LLAATLLMAQLNLFPKEALMRPTLLLVRPEGRSPPGRWWPWAVPDASTAAADPRIE